MVKEKRFSRSFILGTLTGVCALYALETIVGLIVGADFQLIRFLLFIAFGSAAVVFTLMECRKL